MSKQNEELRTPSRPDGQHVILTAREFINGHEVLVRLQQDEGGAFREIAVEPIAARTGAYSPRVAALR